ncbi:MAG: CAP domain-containing protein [Hyphomicrobiales bacterium]|nr:CAP domain-containing protein [Hyphomicrobiales bacterium]
MPSLSASLGGREEPAVVKPTAAAAAPSSAGFWEKVQSRTRKGGGEALSVMASRFQPAEALAEINAYRAKKGLSPLRLNAKLTQAAKAHSLDLARNDRISHFGSDGSDIEERARRSGYAFNLIAENVGTGQRSASEVIEGWRKSPSHNENLLLPDAEEMGIAVVYRPETEYQTFWTLVLGASNG